jgi:membrane protease YdiL (CAAX protease family)
VYPTLAAVVLTLSGEGLHGLRGLLGRLFVWRVNVRWYLFALLWPPTISLATTAVYVLSGGGVPNFSNPPFLEVYPLPPELAAISPWPLLPFVFLQYVLLSSPMGEEIGWRGYALPRMQSEWSALRASLVLGFLWGVWHLPLYLTAGHPISEEFFGWFLLGIIADAILFTWLYNSTGGSLLLAVLFHASIAVTGLFLIPAEATPLLGLALEWIFVGGVIAVTGSSRLSRLDKQIISNTKGGSR